MSKTSLIDAVKAFDLDAVQRDLDRDPSLANWRSPQGFNLLQFCCSRSTAAELSLVFFAVARAQNNALARYFLKLGAAPGALFAAAWWGNAEIVADLVRHGEDINRFVGATPLHMAVAVLDRGVDGKPERAGRRLDCLKALLRHGADPNIADHRKETPLHLVLEKGYDVAVFKLLLKHGADPDLPGKDGRTVRETAARKKNQRYFRSVPSPGPGAAGRVGVRSAGRPASTFTPRER